MNMPVEASPDQPALSDARRDSAEAAQRDLSEFLATCDAPPPLAADAPPQVGFAQPPDFAPSDFARASDGIPSVSPDRGSTPDQSERAIPELHPHSVPAHRDAVTEACERAARLAAQAVDDVTKKNLRRLEATMSWLHKEAQACQLPRLPQLAPVRGVPIVQASPASLPGFDAVIDRSSLHRTVHGATMRKSPPLPIWLCEHEAPIRLPPPRRRGELWRRLVKFFWACTVAAPIAYVFAITTAPLHRHLAEIVGLAPAITSPLPAPHVEHAQSRGRDLIAIAPIAAREQSATVAASDTSKQVVVAIPSGVAVVASVAAEAEPLQAARVGEVVAPPDANRAPAWEPAQPPPDQPVIAATTEVGKSRPEGAPAQADEASAPVKPAARHEVRALVAQGKEFFAAGDLVAARILFMRAAKSGDAAAAVAIGTTYDPVVLAERGVRGAAADLDEARAWYERAKDMGSSEGPRRLEMLANR
jgi:hypothetical protein